MEDEYIGKYKKVPEGKVSSLGEFKAEVVNDVNKYCTLTGTKRTEFIEQLIKQELEGKVLTNDFIELDKPFYFNYAELIEEGTVKASTVKPISNLEDVAIVKKVPVNLDKFEADLKTYCYNKNPDLHKGIYIYHKLSWNVYIIEEVIDDFIIFQYDLKANTLELGLIKDIELLDLYVDDNSKSNELLLKGLLAEANVFKKTINDNINYITEEIEFTANINSVFKSFEVIEPYSQKRRLIKQLDLNEEIKSYLLNDVSELTPEDISDSDLSEVFKMLINEKRINEEIIEELVDNSNFIKGQLEEVDTVLNRLNKLVSERKEDNLE